MRSLLKSIIRLSAFVSKESREVLRQPWLVVSLILGPFAILALFGLGYRGDPAVLNTVVVAPNDPRLQNEVEQYAKTLGKQLRLVDLIPDAALAAEISSRDEASLGSRVSKVEDLLRQYGADLVASFPPDAAQRIQRGEAAPLVLYYDTVDPVRDQYIASFGLIYTYEVNRRVLTSAAQQTQGRTTALSQDVSQMRQQIGGVRSAVQAGDRQRASQEASQLSQTTDRVATAVETSAGLLGGVQSSVGGGGQGQSPQSQQAVGAARELRQQVGTLRSDLDQGPSLDQTRRLDDLARIERGLDQLDTAITEFNQIPPQVLAAPFTNVTQNVAPLRPNFVTFYAPGVLALLLQHLAISIAALSLVRERLLGALEVFRVGPLSAFEALAGKYLSFIVLSLVVGVVLLALLAFGLGVPLQGGVQPTGLSLLLPNGQWVGVAHLLYLALALLLLISASLGVGFVISAVSTSDSQAVQLSMIVLLASIFFSGFFLPLDTLYGPARVIAALLPVTYGIQALQAAMLRGEHLLGTGVIAGVAIPLNQLALVALLLMTLALFVASLLLFQRQLKGT
ncbi:MAG: ABC transporter permease [Anaerolineae bacterium]|nr:ABC transporter permease [Anaerolineae bacterium]